MPHLPVRHRLGRAADPAGQHYRRGDCGCAVDPGLSPGGRFLYVNESRVDSVGLFAVSGDGNLTELPGSPAALPPGATPAGIAVS